MQHFALVYNLHTAKGKLDSLGVELLMADAAVNESSLALQAGDGGSEQGHLYLGIGGDFYAWRIWNGVRGERNGICQMFMAKHSVAPSIVLAIVTTAKTTIATVAATVILRSPTLLEIANNEQQRSN